MNLTEIENTIEELESGETTFVNCQKLASLYTVRDHFREQDQAANVVPRRSVLQTYLDYCEIKGQYQKHMLPAESVAESLGYVCEELKELIGLLYSNSDMEMERNMLIECVQSLGVAFEDR